MSPARDMLLLAMPRRLLQQDSSAPAVACPRAEHGAGGRGVGCVLCIPQHRSPAARALGCAVQIQMLPRSLSKYHVAFLHRVPFLLSYVLCPDLEATW